MHPETHYHFVHGVHWLPNKDLWLQIVNNNTKDNRGFIVQMI